MPTRPQESALPTVPASAELFAPITAEIELCYQTFGEAGGDPLLLIMGLGGPMTWWDEDLCRRLAADGFFVIRYDNRDVGRSSRATGTVRKDAVVRAFLGRRVRTPYSMADLAEDARLLLDHLGIPAAHLAGVSMGGMIAQTLALSHPQRVLSLTSIMSTTGHRRVGWQHPALLPTLALRRGPSREAYISAAAKVWRIIGSPAYPTSEEKLRKRAADTYDRGVSEEGVLRQMMAVLTQPDRTADLARIDVPTTVVHGLADKMVHSSGGRATARATPGAQLRLIAGMGHDLPPALHSTLADAIRSTADRAAARSR